MPRIQDIRHFDLKVIFLTHFIFISLSSMGFWNSSAYIFYNIFLILSIVWSIYQPQSEESLQLAIVINGVSIILDILLLIMCYPSSNRAGERFSAAMCILHLIIRPVTCIFMIKNLEDRCGSSNALSGLFTSSNQQQQSSYEDIDRSPVQTTGGYNFDSAQQI